MCLPTPTCSCKINHQRIESLLHQECELNWEQLIQYLLGNESSLYLYQPANTLNEMHLFVILSVFGSVLVLSLLWDRMKDCGRFLFFGSGGGGGGGEGGNTSNTNPLKPPWYHGHALSEKWSH